MLDKDNIAMIEFEQSYPGLDAVPMVVFFHKERVTEEKAKSVIALYGYGEDDNVIIISKRQYQNVFMK